MNKLLTTQQAADHLNLKKATLEAWRVQGKFLPFVKLSRTVRYRESDLDAFVEQNCHNSTSER